MINSFYYFWEYWQLYHKVTFDAVNKIVLVNHGETFLDFKVDVYSAWKEWMMLESHQNPAYLPALRAVGGDPIDADNGVFIGTSYFFTNGWRMKTWAGNHRLYVSGNVFTEEGDNVFLPAIVGYSVTIDMRTSNIVDLITVSNESSGSSVSAEEIAVAVRTELSTELSRLDATISSRATQTSVDASASSVTLLSDILTIIDSKLDFISDANDNIAVSLVDMFNIMVTLKKYNTNRSKIDPSTKTLTIYDDDSTTPLLSFSLLDSTQAPSIIEVAEKVPI